MPQRQIFPEWPAATENTKFPFSVRATLVNEAGRVIPDNTWRDAALYPIGADVGLYLASAEVSHGSVTLTLATPTTPGLATATFSLLTPPDDVAFLDAYDRPAGVLVGDGERLGLFQSWGVGTHEFLPEQTEFAAAVVFPTPEVGVRAFRLESGELFSGEVWFVGSDGVVLRPEDVSVPVPGTCLTRTVRGVRVDVVGDPLFRQRLCQPVELYQPPRFVRSVRVTGERGEDFTLTPDSSGNLRLFTNDAMAADPILRITPTSEGVQVGVAGG